MIPGGGGVPPQILAVLSALQGQQGGNPAQNAAEQGAESAKGDPTMIYRQLDRINQLLGVLFVQSFQRFPNVANNISQTMKQLSRAIKEAQSASQVQGAVAGGPVQQSAVEGGTMGTPPGMSPMAQTGAGA